MATQHDQHQEHQLPDALRARLLAEIATEKVPTRAQVRGRRVVAGLACFAALLPLVMGLRGDFHQLPLLYALGTVVCASAGAGALLAFGLSRGPAMMGPRFGVLLGALLLVPSALVAFLLLIATPGQASAVIATDRAVRAILVCDAIAIAVALPPLFAALAYRRVFSATSPALVGALLGAAAGLLAHVGVHLHCAATDRAHLMLGHFLPAVPLALIGAWALSRKKP